VFLAIHDPTTLNRQGADVGPQYRSIILAHDDDQESAARREETVRQRVLRGFRRHGLLEDPVVHEMLAWDHAGGFSLDASVRIPAHDRAGLERLLRYCARPPFAPKRIEWHRAGDGEEGVVLKPATSAHPRAGFWSLSMAAAATACAPSSRSTRRQTWPSPSWDKQDAPTRIMNGETRPTSCCLISP
jgi:hypothetical protein